MSRPKRRRAKRKEQKRDLPLTATEIVRLNAQRTLPPGHPSADKDYYIPSPLGLSWHAIDVTKRSEMLPYLERKLRTHPGKTSALSILALLAVMVIAAFLGPSYRRSDLCAVLNGLEAEVAWELGLCSRVARKLFGYHAVVKQCLRLERALVEGWVDEDGTVCDQNWFVHCLFKANITPEEAEQITAIAIDSTFLLAWAVPHKYPEGEEPPSGQRSADLTAEFGHRSATAKRKAGKRLGHDLHIVCGVRGRKKWQGQPTDANLEDEPVSLVPLHMKLVPADPNVAPIALECIEWAKKIAPNAKEVLADRLYSMKYERFNRRLHQAAMQAVMDLDKSEVKRVRQHMFGTNQHCLIENCGTFFPWSMNEELRKPPPGLKGKKRRKWFDRRAKFRYSVDSIDPETGDIRFLCPQCAGRIRSNLKTRNPKVRANKNAPFIVRTDDAEYCCPGRVTVPVKYLDRYQSIPYGTTAHKKSYNRRNQIENLNGILRDKGGLEDRWCRSLVDGARFVGSVMMCVAFLLRETKQEWLNGNGGNGDDPEAPDDDEAELNSDQPSTDEISPDETDTGQSGDRSRDGPD